MAYCTYAEIVSLTGTEYLEADVDVMIAEADREINGILAFNGLTGGSDAGIKSASIKLSIVGVITRGRVDGNSPGTLTIGDLTLSDNKDEAIKQLRESALSSVNSFVKTSNKSNVDNWMAITNE